MIPSNFFRSVSNTHWLESLLASVVGGHGKDIGLIIKELEQKTWDEVRVIQNPDDAEPAEVFSGHLLDAIEQGIIKSVGHHAINITKHYNIHNAHLMLDDYRAADSMDWRNYLTTNCGYNDLREMVSHIGELGSMDTKRNNAIIDEIFLMGIDEAIIAHSLDREEISKFNISLPAEHMPVQIKQAIASANLIKTFVEQNLKPELAGRSVVIDNDGITIFVRIAGGGRGIYSMSDILKVTKAER